MKDALADAGFVGLNVVPITGRGSQRGVVHQGRGGQSVVIDMLPKTKLELVVQDSDTDKICEIIVESARTGEIGDGKIFVLPLERCVRIRTGEEGNDAIG